MIIFIWLCITLCVCFAVCPSKLVSSDFEGQILASLHIVLTHWGCSSHFSDASRLQNCRNSAKCIYRRHKWKASTPIRPQKMRVGGIFQQPVQPLNFFLKSALLPGVVCVTFYDWSAAYSSTSRCICLMKSRQLSSWAWTWMSSRAEVNFAWFQLQFIKEAENSCSRRVREWEKGGVCGGRWSWGWGHFFGRFSVSSVCLIKFKLRGWPVVVLLFGPPASLL